MAREGDRIRALASPYTKQITGFFDRRMSRLDALRAFVEAEPAMQSLDADFPTFAEGLSSAANGVRAFQLVRKARIIRSWPTYDDSLLVGYNLLTHPNPEVVDGVRRAMATHVGVISGPITLLQGGEGLIVRQRLEPFSPDAPDMVAMVLDLESLISEAALPSIPRIVAYALIEIAHAESTRMGFNHSQPINQRAALIAIDQMGVVNVSTDTSASLRHWQLGKRAIGFSVNFESAE
jgi:sensor domain CHASE-containing protein